MKTLLSMLVILASTITWAGPRADYSKAQGIAAARAAQAEAKADAAQAKQRQQDIEATRQARISQSLELLKRQGVDTSGMQVVDGGSSESKSTYGGPGAIDLGANQYFASNGQLACRIEFSVQSLPGMGTAMFPPTAECLPTH